MRRWWWHLCGVSVLCCWLAVCDATAHGGVRLLFANRKDIRLLELDGRRANGSRVLVDGLEDAAALDFLYEGGLLFWTDVGLEVIRRRSLDGTDLTVASMGVVSPDGLACDWVGRKLYWTDSETNRLEVAELDGSHRKVLLWRDLDQPRAIALVPTDGLLFWTDWGDVPKIERASMDGNLTTRKVIVREDIFWPNGLTVDYEARRIYWVDAKLKLISSMNYDGEDRAVVIHGSLSLPFALTVLGDTLYWTDWQLRAVLSCSKQTGAHKRTVLVGELDPMDIQAYSALRQPKGEGSQCSYNNGGCSHLCLVSSEAPFYSCACPTGVRLLNDSRTCAQGAEQILLLARRKDLRRISLDTPDYTDVVLPLRGLKHAIALDYDPVEGRVYWTDDELCLIQRAFLNGSGQEAVVTLEVQHPDGLAVDVVARNLYWTDTGTDRIEVARLNGTARKVLIAEGLAEPRAIVLDPPQGWMYWTDWGQPAKIERAALDGSERRVLVSTDLGWPNGLALDARDGRLYWADARTDRIESSLLDGSDRKVLLDNQLPHVFGFTLLGQYIYWTDWQGRSIERLHKRTGERLVILDQLPDLMGIKAVSVHARPGENDCSRANGGCSHLCLQRPHGGRVCACPTGLELRADLRGCTVAEAFLLYAQHSDIRRISLQSRRTDQIPLAGVREVAALDYDGNDGRLYWSDKALKRISRAFLNGSQLESIVEFGLELPESLAVDWVGRNLYWADLVLKRIEVSRLDGQARRVLLWQRVDVPRALVLEPKHRWMFWSDWGIKDPRIERAALDGSQRKRLSNVQVGRVNSLTIDHAEQRLYWIDIDANHIGCCEMDGDRQRVVVPAAAAQRPFGLTQYQEYLYWTDLEGHSIERALKSTGANRSRLLGQLKYIDDLLVFHTSRQAGWNQCAVYNGGCSHLCLGVPGPRGFQCACPTHHLLGPNNRTCQRPPSFLLFSQKSSISRLGLNADDSPDIMLPIQGLKNIRALEFDPVADFLYWIDGKSHVIRRSRDNGTQVTTVAASTGAHPFALALDPYARQLFWSCSQGNLINISSLDSGRPLGILLASGDDRPRHLALHPHLGVLVWSNLVNPALIERSFVDGSARQTLVSKELRQPGALAMDCPEERLYWSDLELQRVEHVHLTGEHRKVVLSNVQANALAVFGEQLFILDRTEQCILRAHKLSGADMRPLQARRPHLSALVAVQRRPTETAPHPCTGHRCSHLCRAVRGRAQCACPPGLVLRGSSDCVTAARCSAEHEFGCATGGCVAMEVRCDGANDCADRSDERDCAPGCAPGTEFRCRDGGCVPKPRLCDGTADCADESDELCCGADRFACHSRDQCIDRSRVCDRRPDCADRSDELVCEAVSSAGRTATTTVVLLIVFGSLTVLLAIGLCCYQQRTRTAPAAAPHAAAYRMLPYPKPPAAPPPSSTASSNGYPRETLNPPPSPATLYGGPTPCSTDVCDDSEPCRCDDSLYDSDPNPPPPTPRSRGCVSDASCPPSPLNERAFCHPPPPSPVPESDY
uniref:Low density lipoprotein receptor-related protein 5/6 n=1 Tax=Rhipicephalus appendiculatus TaxID=34631 RepID=A0A131YQ22_RHIAP